MANIGPVPINMNRASLKIDVDNYEKSVSSAKLTPATPIAKFKGIGGNTEKRAGVPDWLFTCTYAQDWATPNSLSQYNNVHAGETKEVELTPDEGGQTAIFTILIIDGDMGGDVDSTTTASVTYEVIGQPVFEDAE